MAKRRSVRAWENLDDAAIHELGADGVARATGSVVLNCAEADSLDAGERERLRQVLDLIARAERVLGVRSVRLLVLKLMALGKLGRFDEALAEGRRAYEQAPNWDTAIGVANACQRAGDVKGAVEMFAAAADHDPEDVTALLSIGDLHLDRGRWLDALDAYERALAREKDNGWAIPSAHFCHYRLTGDARWRSRLRRLAREKPDACGVEAMLTQFVGGYPGEVRRQRAQYLATLLERDQ